MIEYQNLFTRVQVRTTTEDWGVPIEDDTWRKGTGIDTKSGLLNSFHSVTITSASASSHAASGDVA